MLFCRWILSGVREETVVLFWCFATHAWDGTRKNVLQPKNSRFNLGPDFNSMQVHFPVQRSWWDKPGKCTLLHYWCNLKQQKCVRNCGDPLKSKIEPVLIVFKVIYFSPWLGSGYSAAVEHTPPRGRGFNFRWLLGFFLFLRMCPLTGPLRRRNITVFPL